MIYVDITSDNRGEGKTTLALAMLREGAHLLTRKGTKYLYMRVYGLSNDEVSRIVESVEELRGQEVDVLVMDLT